MQPVPCVCLVSILGSSKETARWPATISTSMTRESCVWPPLASTAVSSCADSSSAASPTSLNVNHQGQFAATTITFNLPPGVSNAPFGEQEWQGEVQHNFMVALVAGILLVFGVLVLLYHRVVSPLVNMGSLFLAPFGGVLAIWMVGQPISMPVFIGVLMLLGIVAKNSILLIDFAIEEMGRGVAKYDAIVAAGHKRAQPIVMTTVAMTAGMIPPAISLSGDAAFRAPMGTVVIGGLIVSTLLTLLIVPAGFSLADGFEKRIGPWLRDRILTYKPGDERRGRFDPGGEAEAHPAE